MLRYRDAAVTSPCENRAKTKSEEFRGIAEDGTRSIIAA